MATASGLVLLSGYLQLDERSSATDAAGSPGLSGAPRTGTDPAGSGAGASSTAVILWPAPTGTSTAPAPSAPPTPHASPTSAAARPPATSAAPAPTPIGTGASNVETQVLALINQERAANGLPAYTLSSGLMSSAASHNRVMASGCGLSHQCPGEAPIGDRETAAGVHWSAAGENIGEGGPIADTTAAEAQMALGITQSMYDEKPPDDGHRLNILSRSFAHIGIAVSRDSSGTLWLTQDFSN